MCYTLTLKFLCQHYKIIFMTGIHSFIQKMFTECIYFVGATELENRKRKTSKIQGTLPRGADALGSVSKQGLPRVC